MNLLAGIIASMFQHATTGGGGGVTPPNPGGTPLSTRIINDGATGYWRFENDGTGKPSLAAHDAQSAHALALVTGSAGTLCNGLGGDSRGGMSVLQSGNTSYSVANDPAFGVDTNMTWTLEFILRTPPADNHLGILFECSDGSGQSGFSIQVRQDTGTYGLVMYSNGTSDVLSTNIPATGNITDGLSHHIVIACAGTVGFVYIDGVDCTNGNTVGVGTLAGAALSFFGRADGSYGLNGSVDEVALYPFTMTPMQVFQHFASYLGTTYEDRVIASNPVGYWGLGGAGGLLDKTINGHDLTGTLKTAAALAGTDGATVFDGSNVLDTGIDVAGWGAISFEAWVSSANAAVAGQASQLIAGDNYHAMIWQHSAPTFNGVFCVNSQAGTYTAQFNKLNPLQKTSLYHLVGTYDGSYVCAYVNGVLVDREAFSVGALVESGVTWKLSRGTSWPGVMDEAALYNRALTQAEVISHYMARIGAPPTYEQEVLVDSPTYYWPLTDALGSTTAADLGPNGHPLQVTGGALGRPGIVNGAGTAMFVDGTTQYASAAFQSAMNFPQDMTFELWAVIAKSQPSGSVHVIANLGTDYNGTGNAVQQIGFSAGGAVIQPYLFVPIDGSGSPLAQPANTAGNPAYDDGLPHHIVGIRRGPNLELRIDGLLVATYTGSDNSATRMNSGPLTLAGNGGYPFIGVLGHIALYGYAMDPARVLAHYRAGMNTRVFPVNLMGYYRASGARLSSPAFKTPYPALYLPSGSYQGFDLGNATRVSLWMEAENSGNNQLIEFGFGCNANGTGYAFLLDCRSNAVTVYTLDSWNNLDSKVAGGTFVPNVGQAYKVELVFVPAAGGYLAVSVWVDDLEVMSAVALTTYGTFAGFMGNSSGNIEAGRFSNVVAYYGNDYEANRVTWNPADSHPAIGIYGQLLQDVYSNGVNGQWNTVRATLGIEASTADNYFEVTPTYSYTMIGILPGTDVLNNTAAENFHFTGWTYFCVNGAIYHDNASQSTTRGWGSGPIGIRIKNGKMYVRDNNGWMNGGDPDGAETGFVASGLTGVYYPAVSIYQGGYSASAAFTGSQFQYPNSGPPWQADNPSWFDALAASAPNACFGYDINDLQTVFQDTAATIPAKAVGDPVGAIYCKKANFLCKVTAGAPTLQYDAVHHLWYVEIDAATNFASAALSVPAAFEGNTVISISGVFASAGSTPFCPGYIGPNYPNNPAGSDGLSMLQQNDPSLSLEFVQFGPSNGLQVPPQAEVFDLYTAVKNGNFNGALVQIWQNNTSLGEGAISGNPSVPSSSLQFNIGRALGAGALYSMFYGVCAMTDAQREAAVLAAVGS